MWTTARANQLAFASVAQLVEQFPFKELVFGSSPNGGTKMRNVIFFSNFNKKRRDAMDFAYDKLMLMEGER